MKIALLIIATGGERYLQYLRPLIESANKHCPTMNPIVFTDAKEPYGAVQVYHKDLGWPDASLMRFHAFLHRRDFLERYDYLVYCDVDMLFASKVEPEELICDAGMTAVLHASYPQSFERRPTSTACIEGAHPYYTGCIFAGPADAFLTMADAIAKNVDADKVKGITALWYDESHLNRYFVENPPARVLTPAYAFPEAKYLVTPEKWQTPGWVPKILHLEKPNQAEWKNAARK